MNPSMRTGGLRRNLSTQENRDFFDFLDRCAAEVAQWPAWKRGDYSELMKAQLERQQRDYEEKTYP